MGVKRRTRKNQLPPSLVQALRRAYPLMRARFGHLHWWPGDSPFEVCVGAILTQNTAWTNVERALARLKAVRCLEPRKLYALPEHRLAEYIRPAGYFNVKARRLRAFLRVLVEDCDADLDRLFTGPRAAVRARLLAIPGIGPETADSMLLYAGGQLSFVVDAYTHRIFARHQWLAPQLPSAPRGRGPSFQKPTAVVAERGNDRQSSGVRSWYADLQALCEAALRHKTGPALLDYWQDYHAQLVQVGKHFCRPRAPRCDTCPLQPLLPPG